MPRALTTMTWVTLESTSSPAIIVLSRTPLVQNVSKVLGETLNKEMIFDHYCNIVLFISYVKADNRQAKRMQAYIDIQMKEIMRGYMIY